MITSITAGTVITAAAHRIEQGRIGLRLTFDNRDTVPPPGRTGQPYFVPIRYYKPLTGEVEIKRSCTNWLTINSNNK